MLTSNSWYTAPLKFYFSYIPRLYHSWGSCLSDTTWNAKREITKFCDISLFNAKFLLWTRKCQAAFSPPKWPLWGLDSKNTRPKSMVATGLWSWDSSYTNRDSGSTRCCSVGEKVHAQIQQKWRLLSTVSTGRIYQGRQPICSPNLKGKSSFQTTSNSIVFSRRFNPGQ